MSRFIEQVLNPARLAALRRLGLLDTPAELAFDRLGTLAAKLLNAPVALVTLVDDTRQFFKGCIGLPEPWATWRHTPLSHSFCQHVVASHEPLIISDAREDPLFRDNLAIKDLGVIAYLGIPLVMTTGEVLGSFCVIDSQPRIWTREEVDTLKALSESVMTEIELRSEIRHRNELIEEVRGLNASLVGQAEALRSANTELETFSYSVSHDLRSPVRTIKALSQAFGDPAEQLSDAEQRDFLDRIVDAASRIEQIIEGLLLLAGVTRAPLNITRVDLSALARSAISNLQKAEPERSVRVEIDSDLVAQADERLMRVALENLICNAWKFTRKTPNPRIEFRSELQDGRRVFFVRDNGAGFDMAAAEKLFRGFERLHSRADFEGTGIGLRTVAKIIERHGGRIWAEGKVGAGATFYFAFPEPAP
jgi:signal transduction histidine kinase